MASNISPIKKAPPTDRMAEPAIILPLNLSFKACIGMVSTLLKKTSDFGSGLFSGSGVPSNCAFRRLYSSSPIAPVSSSFLYWSSFIWVESTGFGCP